MNRETQIGGIRFKSRTGERVFAAPARVVATHALDEVSSCLREVEAEVASGRWAAGFIAYEAAPAFSEALETHPPSGVPLVWFGICGPPVTVTCPAIGRPSSAENHARDDSVSPEEHPWRTLVDEDVYRATVQRIRALIAAGDTYQVNYTFPMTAPFEGDAAALFERLWRAQPCDYAAFVDAGRFKVASVSPELFFRLHGDALTTKPMKGTRRRGRWPEEDRHAAEALAGSEKERAENVMIVDLLRSDMGRISETGSVHVPRLFDVERYETVWQMTSTIESRTTASVPEIFGALFPSGSVTGAPKVRTMQIIREMEPHPRGVYCGAIGWWGPGRQAEFNVAIRTVTVDTERREARYNVGGGITWDSDARAEHAECRAKAAVLSTCRPEFELLESLLFDGTYFLLERHLHRLAASAEYFGFNANLTDIREALLAKGATLGVGEWKVRSEMGTVPSEASPRTETGLSPFPGEWKVRLLVSRNGSFRIEAAPVKATNSRADLDPPKHVNAKADIGATSSAFSPSMNCTQRKAGADNNERGRLVAPLRLAFAAEPIDSHDVFLFHKTTHRTVYERALASRPDCGDVLLWNERGEITETSSANVVLLIDGHWLTPPIGSGLLAGTMRADLLERGEIHEAVLTKADVSRASRIALINSVSKRAWLPQSSCIHVG